MQSDSENLNGNSENSSAEQEKELSTNSERVGFSRPPQATRFRKGVSGNPNGRPKGTLNVATAFMKALREKVVINEHGRRKTITKLEAAVKQLVNKAASGDLRALSQLVVLAQDAEAKQSIPTGQNLVTSEIDQEVMEGISNRFVNTAEQPKAEEK
jgi:hypothetical protein